MSEQQQQRRRYTTVSAWKKTQAANNNGNCSENKVGYSVQKHNNGSSSSYTNGSTRTISLSRIKKNKWPFCFGYSVQKTLEISTCFCALFSVLTVDNMREQQQQHRQQLQQRRQTLTQSCLQQQQRERRLRTKQNQHQG